MDANSVGVMAKLLISETALFYSFSTIAQTLAGAFAILGAFVLFKTQSINKVFENITEIFCGLNSAIGYESRSTEDWVQYIDEFEKYYSDNWKDSNVLVDNLRDKDFLRLIDKFKKNIELKITILTDFLLIFIYTATAIAISLISLPFVSVLVGSKFIIILLVSAILLSLVCLYYYGELLKVSLAIDYRLIFLSLQNKKIKMHLNWLRKRIAKKKRNTKE